MKHARLCVRIAAGMVLAGCSSGDGGPPTGNNQTGTISGQVVDADSGDAGIAGVSVQLAGPSGTQTVTTGAGGAFSLGGAATGSWSATLQLPASYRLAATESGTRTANVSGGQTATLTRFRMARPRGSVSGAAMDNGTGIAGGTVAATRSGFTSANATPTAAGYTIADLPVGTWALAYTPPATHELAAGENGTRTIAITEGQTAAADAFQLKPAPPQSQVVEIHLSGTSFVPSSVTIAAGTTVRWINDANVSHTVTPENTSQAGVWQAQSTSSQGVVFEHTFETSNQTYRYRCVPHSSSFDNGMVGSITVT